MTRKRNVQVAALAGRAVSIMLLGDDGGQEHINKDTWAQYVGDGSKLDHVVCIVGWDDKPTRLSKTPTSTLPALAPKRPGQTQRWSLRCT